MAIVYVSLRGARTEASQLLGLRRALTLLDSRFVTGRSLHRERGVRLTVITTRK